MLMDGFKPGSSGVGSNSSANCAPTLAHWGKSYVIMILNVLGTW